MNEKEKIPSAGGEIVSGEIEDLIPFLEEIKRRIVDVDLNMGLYGEEYCKMLAEIDRNAIDRTIIILKRLE